MYADDTIAAIATAPGQSGIGVVRLSGPLSTSIADQTFLRNGNHTTWDSHRLYVGSVLRADGTAIDHGLAVVMRRPRSYTGEDVLELHCHGSPVILREVLSHVLQRGARLAQPGEFTKRAFLNGRLDLTQAEAVIDAVRARTGAAAASATRQLGGELSAYLDRIREQLLHLKALLEVQIDFSDEDITIGANELLVLSEQCLGAMQRLLLSYQHGKVLRDGARVVIVGKPNVGKSSLLNALLGEDRAIVTPIAGTTRDTIEEAVDVDGLPVILTDTAGLRDDGSPDPVEDLGIKRTASMIDAADLLLAVFDASSTLDSADRALAEALRERAAIAVLNKIDLPQTLATKAISDLLNGAPVVRVSAKALQGLAELRRTIAARLTSSTPVDDGIVVTNVRHHDALMKALNSLQLAHASMRDGRPADIVAVDVQDSMDRLAEITGLVTNEDVLDKIFRDFCIGK